MTTWLQQRKADLMKNLWHAQRLLAEYRGDPAGQVDLVLRVRRVDEQFRELGGSPDEYREFIEREEAEAERSKLLARERSYERTGIVQKKRTSSLN
jgi:hypothetical protein